MGIFPFVEKMPILISKLTIYYDIARVNTSCIFPT